MKTSIAHQTPAKEEAEEAVVSHDLLSVGHRQEDQLDDEHPLWCVNEQIKDLLIGFGASEDHAMVIQFFRETGLPEGTVARIHKAIVCAESSPLNVPMEARPDDGPPRQDGL